jgi:uncharacterized FlaG/YvyC family protein
MSILTTQPAQGAASQALTAVATQNDAARSAQAVQLVQAALKTQQSSGAPEDQSDPGSEQGSKQLSRQDAEKLVNTIQKYFDSKGVSLNFKVLGGSDGVQVQVMDAQSGKVLLKIPDDELVKLGDSLKREAKGVMDKSV